MYQGRRVFRNGPGWTLAMVAITMLFAGVAYGMYSLRGWNWASVSMTLVAGILGVGGIVESLVQRIDLTDDAMLVTELTGRRRYARQDIDRVAEAKGVAPILLLRNGAKVKLPSVGSDLGNSVRAWLTQP